ncbi:MAG: helix-turn-helix domain-containing protein [bacterium]
MEDNLLTIGEAAEMLNISIDTLRRWDKSGRLSAFHKPSGHRYYRRIDIELALDDLSGIAKKWALDKIGREPQEDFYCPTSYIFQGRLAKLENVLSKIVEIEKFFPLITAIVGEIGNNSFDHNLGNWPDISGVFFGCDLNKRQVVLADRGLGIFSTLKRVKPELKNHEEALKTAFTEIISGRAPEARGNGLKFVRQVIMTNKNISLFFQTGDAQLEIKKNSGELNIKKSDLYIKGCFTIIKY